MGLIQSRMPGKDSKKVSLELGVLGAPSNPKFYYSLISEGGEMSNTSYPMSLKE